MTARPIKEIFISVITHTGQLFVNVDGATYHDVGRVQYIPGQLLLYRTDRATLQGSVFRKIGKKTVIRAAPVLADADFILRKGWPIYPPTPKPTEDEWREMKHRELMALVQQDYEHDMQAERDGGPDDDD
jgi:hypothetical protein